MMVVVVDADEEEKEEEGEKRGRTAKKVKREHKNRLLCGSFIVVRVASDKSGVSES